MAVGIEPDRPPAPLAPEVAGPLGAIAVAPPGGQWRLVARRFRRRRMALAGLVIHTVAVLLG